MHHTDYSSNLRKAQHKTIKILSLNKPVHRQSTDRNPELLRTALAAIMVVLVLLQMDPANASTYSDASASDAQAQSNLPAYPVGALLPL